MSFYTSLSGLNAAQTDLNVTSNNIANVSTAGFKSSRAEFGDIISSSAFQAQNSVIGQGTRLKSITQEFSQGSEETTSRALDLTVSGQGFFVTKSAGTGAQVSFTRDGSFSVDGNNNVVDSTGAALQVLPVDSLGNVTATGTAAMQSLRVPATNGTAKQTSTIDLSVTLPSSAAIPTSTFSPTNASSYNNATSTTVYDSAGDAIPATVYYVHTANATPASTDSNGVVTPATESSWTAHTFVGDKEVFPAGTTNAPVLNIASDGTVDTATSTASGAYTAVDPTGASAPLSLTITYGSGTKEGNFAFSTVASSQDGNTVGKLSNLTVDAGGLVSATYSDSSTVVLGKVAVANFVNPDGLHQSGNTTWTATASSGAADIGAANTDGRGEIASGTLESSNVDLTAELVNLISAQRNFQANAKAIDTDKQMLQSIINLQ
ncbi:flagellar hook protein FlgE [uncultured Sphingomonas sp.]|uniref:flagellar hook protein FlgE n=1 Tax=uncultured Sphingomonas sp. TaxID=158754 RepID=UPI002616D3FA|nr:flagellar hook protein FlgE [uncultured Sphingomonas sp.]